MDNNSAAQICVMVIYAQADAVFCTRVSLPNGARIADALDAAQVFNHYPELERGKLYTGIYGQRWGVEHRLLHGDRVEIYRPLVFDPNQSRLRRAAHRKALKGQRPANSRHKPG